MSVDATLDEQEGAPGMDALRDGQEPVVTTTGTDGEPAVETPPEEPPKSRRELAMEDLAAKRLLDLEAETGHSFEEREELAADDRETGTPAERKLTVKVDGKEMSIGEAELVRGYQKDATASLRLEEAAQARKDLEAERAQLAEERAEIERMRAGGTAQPDPAPDGDSQATPIGEDADAKKIYDDLVSGDEEAAVKAIEKLTKGRQTEAIPPEQIAARVRQQIAWEDAQRRFAEDFTDISADELLRQIASNTLKETLKTSQSYDQAFREAGERTRAWARKVGGRSAQGDGGQRPEPPGLAEKQSRKERIDNPTVIDARAGGKPKEQVESPTDVIAQMRKDRGLPT